VLPGSFGGGAFAVQYWGAQHSTVTTASVIFFNTTAAGSVGGGIAATIGVDGAGTLTNVSLVVDHCHAIENQAEGSSDRT
jgi:hypothetical protein